MNNTLSGIGERIDAKVAYDFDILFHRFARKAENPASFNEAQQWVAENVVAKPDGLYYLSPLETATADNSAIEIRIDLSLMDRSHPFAMLLTAHAMTMKSIIERMRNIEPGSSDAGYWSEILIIKESGYSRRSTQDLPRQADIDADERSTLHARLESVRAFLRESIHDLARIRIPDAVPVVQLLGRRIGLEFHITTRDDHEIAWVLPVRALDTREAFRRHDDDGGNILSLIDARDIERRIQIPVPVT